MRASLVSALAVAAALFAEPASAAPPLAVMSLPALAKPPAAPATAKEGAVTPGFTVTVTSYNAAWYQVNAATSKGYCILQPFGERTIDNFSSNTADSGETFAVRLVEKDGIVTLEKSVLEFDAQGGKLRLGARVSVELKEVARSSGLVVWGYREAQDAVLVARGVDGGFDSPHRGPDDQGTLSFLGTSGCPYSVARLDLPAAKSGASAQMTGDLKAKGKPVEHFVVDASLSRVTRDPAPLLAVRVRFHD